MNSSVISPPKSNSRSNLLSTEQARLHLVVLATPTCTPYTYSTNSRVLHPLKHPSLYILTVPRARNTSTNCLTRPGAAPPAGSFPS